MFTISSVKANKPPTYTIKDTLREPVQGTFYEQELQLSVHEIFHIERVPQEEKSSNSQVERLQCSVQFVGTINRPRA